MPSPTPVTRLASTITFVWAAGATGARLLRMAAPEDSAEEDPVLLVLRSPAARLPRPGPGTGPLAARLVAGQRRAGQCGDERGRGQAAGEQGPLAVGSGPPVLEPAQQPGDRLGVAVVAERGVDVLQQ